MSVVDKLGRVFHGIAMVSNAVGTLVIFALIIVMNADVFSRNFFDAPLRGVVEMVIFSLVLIVFLQLPDVVRKNRLTRSDGFLILGRSRFPRFTNVLDRVIDATAGVFMALITWTVWPEFAESIATCHFLTAPEFGPEPSGQFIIDLKAALSRCEYFGTPGIFTAPWWPAKLAIVFSAGICTLIFLMKAIVGEHQAAPDTTGNATA